MPLNALTRASLVDQVISQLHDLIERGEWPVGSKIPTEAELVDQLGVGRNTLREAIRALGYAGMLESRQGDGTYVTARSDLGPVLRRRLQRATLLEALEVRNSLERDAARLAAIRRTPDDLARIQRALERQQDDLVNGNEAAIVDDDVAFHRAIVAATHNRVLVDLYEHFTVALRAAIAEAISPRTGAGVRVEEHIAIVEAIARGNAEEAEQAAVTHLIHSIAAVEAYDEGVAVGGASIGTEPMTSR